MYMMEKESGFAFKNAIEKGFISREQLFIVSKVILYLLYFPYQIVQVIEPRGVARIMVGKGHSTKNT